MPTQTLPERRTHATFNALLWALAHPGRMQTLHPEPEQTAFAAIAEALLDLETTAFTTDGALEPILRRLGARPAPLDRAEYVFVPSHKNDGALDDLSVLRDLGRGSLLAPDTAATLIMGARFDAAGPRVRFTGPGVDGALEVGTDLPLAFWSLRAEAVAFPIGWDAFLVDGHRVIGVPRSTRAEVI